MVKTAPPALNPVRRDDLMGGLVTSCPVFACRWISNLLFGLLLVAIAIGG
jgi:hypothetical protein